VIPEPKSRSTSVRSAVQRSTTNSAVIPTSSAFPWARSPTYTSHRRFAPCMKNACTHGFMFLATSSISLDAQVAQDHACVRPKIVPLSRLLSTSRIAAPMTRNVERLLNRAPQSTRPLGPMIGSNGPATMTVCPRPPRATSGLEAVGARNRR